MSGKDAFLFEDDGLAMPEVGHWAETKHSKLSYYSRVFSTSMKQKWGSRVYLDLFSAAGKARVRESGNVIPGSPLLALNVPDPFDHYVFCEQDERYLSALKQRVSRYFPTANVEYVERDSNQSVEDVLRALPRFRTGNTGLTLCFADPYKAAELQFQTLARIAARLYVDFLVLVPTYMDIHRNVTRYTELDCPTLDLFLGDPQWRTRWPDSSRPGREFGLFIAEEFCDRMQAMGFLGGLKDLELVRMTEDRNQKLYHLAFFTKNKLALDFWRDTRRNTNQQMSLLD